MIIYTDAEIAGFINEQKVLPTNYYDVLITQLRVRGSHRRSELTVEGVNQNTFHIAIRQSTENSRDFSVILRIEQHITTGDFVLRRYNGASHWHTNTLEREESFRDFHIHQATERYQAANRKPEHYAVVANSYSDIVTALECMIADCGFVMPSDNRDRLI